MFMLIMQFLWKYIDDLMGKGIELSVIIELFFYVSATLIPLALPLAMLLSSIMTLGNLAENNELTALKSAGLSLFKILRPLTFIVLFLSLCTFLFSNFVIPAANLKWRTLIYDIQQTKIATILKPGTYTSVLDGYSIKIKEGNDQSFKGIIIHDHTDPATIKTVRAESGEVFKSKNSNYLFFKLNKGEMLEELQVNSLPQLQGNSNVYPTRRSSFEHATYKIDLTGFKMGKTDEKMFENQYEMWNIFQINEALDSIQLSAQNIRKNFVTAIKNEHIYMRSYIPVKTDATSPQALKPLPDSLMPKGALYISNMSENEKRIAYQNVISRIRRINQNLQAQGEFMNSFQMSLTKFEIEFHRKFALSIAVFVLFFIGAPLGAIVKKGGFGAPVVIALLLFMIYYVLTEIGENLADSGVASPFFGIWLATLVLLPVAFILMRSAAMDSKVFDKETWKKLFKFRTS